MPDQKLHSEVAEKMHEKGLVQDIQKQNHGCNREPQTPFTPWKDNLMFDMYG